MKSRSISCAVAAVAVFGLTAGCGESEVPERPPVVRPVKLVTVGDEAGRQRSFPGRVQAANQVDLSFRVGGPLIELPVREGGTVREGEIVARIDPRDFEIRLASARAERERAEADFRRFSSLYEKEAVSQAQLDQARAERDIARAREEDAEASMRDSRLRAPFTASVGKIFVENFQDVRPKEPVMSLVDVSSVDVVVDLPEALVARIIGDPSLMAVARFDTARGREFELRLKERAAQADPRTQTFRITLTMPQPEDVNILPGMTATVTGKRAGDAIDLGQPLTVPAIAVVGEGGDSHVWVFDPSSRTVTSRAVTVGQLRGSDRIEVTSGLEIGESIAVTAVTQLREGMEVRPLEELEGFGPSGRRRG
ncbi:MAG: efflux RND transporter periplasmic adaptor subunit [Acidobacteria bacterium]|nr:MAG: efflux RND transporter periplasmic adaptor subunit [Acidobacteriota bacterium]